MTSPSVKRSKDTKPETTKDQLSSPTKLASPKSSSSANDSEKLSQSTSQNSNTTLKHFLNTASPKEIPLTLLSVIHQISTGSAQEKPADNTVAKAAIKKKAQTPKVSANTLNKPQYQTSSNNPFLREGYRFIESIKKIYPKTENFDGPLPEEPVLTINPPQTDRPATTNLEKKWPLQSSVGSLRQKEDLEKKFGKALIRLQENKKLYAQEANARKNESKKQQELAKQVEDMRLKLKAENLKAKKAENVAKMVRSRSAGPSKRMQEIIGSELLRQSKLKEKIEGLAKIEEAILERLRATQTLESQAKENMTRLSAMRISKDDIKNGHHKSLRDLKVTFV